VNGFGAPERAAKTGPIKAQSTAMARAMASICDAEWARFGELSGCAGFVHSFSGPAPVRPVLHCPRRKNTRSIHFAAAKKHDE
jgi:hypothetical protein